MLSLRDTLRMRCSGGSSVLMVSVGCEWNRACFSSCGAAASAVWWPASGPGVASAGDGATRTASPPSLRTDAHAPSCARCRPDGDAGTLSETESAASVPGAPARSPRAAAGEAAAGTASLPAKPAITADGTVTRSVSGDGRPLAAPSSSAAIWTPSLVAMAPQDRSLALGCWECRRLPTPNRSKQLQRVSVCSSARSPSLN